MTLIHYNFASMCKNSVFFLYFFKLEASIYQQSVRHLWSKLRRNGICGCVHMQQWTLFKPYWLEQATAEFPFTSPPLFSIPHTLPPPHLHLSHPLAAVLGRSEAMTVGQNMLRLVKHMTDTHTHTHRSREGLGGAL